jgi:hypothetical protein
MIRYIFRMAGLNQQAQFRFPVTETRRSDATTRQRVCQINAGMRTNKKFLNIQTRYMRFFLIQFAYCETDRSCIKNKNVETY